MEIEDKFNLIYDVGKAICAAYTGFSKSEVLHCQQKSNWTPLRQFLMANDPYEALIHFSLHPIADVVGYFQLFIGCMMQFPDEPYNIRLQNLLEIIDGQPDLDNALTNSKMMRALLAINAKYEKQCSSRCFWLFYNCKRVLAHVFRKYPDYLDLNILRTNRKSKSLWFKKEEIDLFW